MDKEQASDSYRVKAIRNRKHAKRFKSPVLKYFISDPRNRARYGYAKRSVRNRRFKELLAEGKISDQAVKIN